jgi:hypothetical protein
MIGEKSVKEDTLLPYEGMWLANSIFFPISIFLLYKASKDSSLFDFSYYVGKIKDNVLNSLNIFITIIASIFYNILLGFQFPYGSITILIIGGIITGMIMIFKKERNNWSSVFMWVTIVSSIISWYGYNSIK